MNIVVVHNFYQQAGGEDQVFAEEAALLESYGHTVHRFTVHNSAVESETRKLAGRLKLAANTIWNRDTAAALAQVVRQSQASVVHFHNTFPLISPAAYRAVHEEGAAVVQTLHNYRLICPAALLYRDGHICEECVGRATPWPAVMHKCYRNNRSASAVTAAMLTINRLRHTYQHDVDRYIALTEFARQKLIAGGLPAHRVVVKPNFVLDTGIGTGDGDYVLFVGRLAPEKGIVTLLSAWKQRQQTTSDGLKLRIVGGGPLEALVLEHAAKDPSIQFIGRVTSDQVGEHLASARLLIFPSEWYEGLPRTIIEAYAKGTPVLASRMGSMIELIEEGRTGALFCPGDSADLIRQLHRLLADDKEMTRLRGHARDAFESKYEAEHNYRLIMHVYESVLASAASFASRRTKPAA